MKRDADHYGRTPKRPADQQTSGLGLFEQQPVEEPVTTVTRTITVQQTVRGDKAVAAQRAQEERNLDARFAEFIAANPQVYAAVEAKCLAEYRQGATVISVKGVVEELRKLARTKAIGSEYAFDNSLTSRMAWLVIDRNPQLRECIRVKRSEAA